MARSKGSKKLNEREERFCQAYIIDLNLTAAAKAAGYGPKGAHVKGSTLKDRPHIAERINELMAARSKKLEVKAEGVLTELARIGYLDPEPIFNDDGTLKPIKDWPVEHRHALASFEVHTTLLGDEISRVEIKKVKFWDKLKANELMGKHQKLFIDRVEHSGKVTLEDLVAGEDEPND